MADNGVMAPWSAEKIKTTPPEVLKAEAAKLVSAENARQTAEGERLAGLNARDGGRAPSPGFTSFDQENELRGNINGIQLDIYPGLLEGKNADGSDMTNEEIEQKWAFVASRAKGMQSDVTTQQIQQVINEFRGRAFTDATGITGNIEQDAENWLFDDSTIFGGGVKMTDTGMRLETPEEEKLRKATEVVTGKEKDIFTGETSSKFDLNKILGK